MLLVDDLNVDEAELVRLIEASKRAETAYWDDGALTEELYHAHQERGRIAEMDLALLRGNEYAEVLDIGFGIDSGAPMPHLMSSGNDVFVILYAQDDTNPAPPGKPADDTSEPIGVIGFGGCRGLRFEYHGWDSEEEHPLARRGLRTDRLHEIHNSHWIEAEGIEGTGPEPVHHYILWLHDESIEILGRLRSFSSREEDFHQAWLRAAQRMGRITTTLWTNPAFRPDTGQADH